MEYVNTKDEGKPVDKNILKNNMKFIIEIIDFLKPYLIPIKS